MMAPGDNDIPIFIMIPSSRVPEIHKEIPGNIDRMRRSMAVSNTTKRGNKRQGVSTTHQEYITIHVSANRGGRGLRPSALKES